MEKQNVYQKLQNARVDLQTMKLQKSGRNEYSKYSYFELPDFLPAVNLLCQKHGLMTQFNLVRDRRTEKAVLTIYNASEPTEKVSFVSPTAEVEIGKKKDGTGGAEPIQNLGGKTTYLRRYLLFTAFEMTETDMVGQIQKELTEELSDADELKIRSAESFEELTKVCGELKKTYKVSLITPLYNQRKVELEQGEAK